MESGSGSSSGDCTAENGSSWWLRRKSESASWPKCGLRPSALVSCTLRRRPMEGGASKLGLSFSVRLKRARSRGHHYMAWTRAVALQTRFPNCGLELWTRATLRVHVRQNGGYDLHALHTCEIADDLHRAACEAADTAERCAEAECRRNGIVRTHLCFGCA